MAKVKTFKLRGLALDQVVARIEGYKLITLKDWRASSDWWKKLPHSVARGLRETAPDSHIVCDTGSRVSYAEIPQFCVDDRFAGPLIDRERICTNIGHDGVWAACVKQNYEDRPEHMHSGNTRLEAAMRTFVSLKLGKEVEVYGKG